MWQFYHFLFHPIVWFFWGSAGIRDNLGDGIITNFGDNLCECGWESRGGRGWRTRTSGRRAAGTGRGRAAGNRRDHQLEDEQQRQIDEKRRREIANLEAGLKKRMSVNDLQWMHRDAKTFSKQTIVQVVEWHYDPNSGRLRTVALSDSPHCINTFTEEDRLNGHIEVDHYMEWRTVRVYLCFLFLTIIGA